MGCAHTPILLSWGQIWQDQTRAAVGLILACTVCCAALQGNCTAFAPLLLTFTEQFSSTASFAVNLTCSGWSVWSYLYSVPSDAAGSTWALTLAQTLPPYCLPTANTTQATYLVSTQLCVRDG